MSETAEAQQALQTEIFTRSMTEQIQDMASYAVYKAAEMVPEGARKPLALLASGLAIGGGGVMLVEASPVLASPKPAGFFESLPSATSPQVFRHANFLRRTCKNTDPLHVNQGVSTKPDRDKLGSLWQSTVEGGDRQKFSWKHSTKNTVCAIEVITGDHKAYFPKPDHEGSKGGYFVDASPSLVNGEAVMQGAEELILYLRAKKPPKKT